MMDMLLDFLTNHGRAIGVVVAVVVSGGLIYQYLKIKRRFKPRTCGVDYPRDTIIVNGLAADKQAPSIGHFAMKLETYLRVNNIKYQCDRVYRVGPKGKVPWIEYNGQSLGDSQHIIQFLEEEFHVNLNAHLTQEERALAWAIQKWIEEFTYWLNVHTRWVMMFETFFDNCQTSIPRYARRFMKSTSRSLTWAVGVGRHSDDEVKAMLIHDLRQFSAILGKKKYIMGSRMSDVDCAAFGILSQVRWCTPDDCPGKQLLLGDEIENVREYLDRIKSQYWPDWEQIRAK